jgi:hypothetical protein
MKGWIGAAVVAGVMALASPASVTTATAAPQQTTKQKADAARATDFSAQFYYRRYYGYRPYYRPYRYYGYRPFYRPYRYYGYRPFYRPYYRPYYARPYFYRPYPYYYGYRPYAFYGPTISIGFGFGPRFWW